MIQIIKYEWKKILRSKLNLTAMAAGLCLIVFCISMWINESFYFNAETNKYSYGAETIKVQQEKNKELTDTLTEEFLSMEIEKIQRQAKESKAESSEDYWMLIRENTDLAAFIASNYGDNLNGLRESGWKILGDIPVGDEFHFYQNRLNEIKEYLELEYSNGNFTLAEKNFWTSKAGQVTTPFLWGDKFSMSNILDIIDIGIYLLIAVVICIAPVFSSEYETGADSLLLTTRYGKSRLIWAKIMTSISFSLLYAIICMGTGILINIAFCGLEGKELPIQLWNSMIPYALNAGESILASAVLVLFGIITVTFLTLFLSAIVKSSFIVLIIDLLILLGPAFLQFGKVSSLWNHILYLFPIHALSGRNVLKTFNSIQAGNAVISYIVMIAVVYITISVISLLGIRKGFAEHQVE